MKKTLKYVFSLIMLIFIGVMLENSQTVKAEDCIIGLFAEFDSVALNSYIEENITQADLVKLEDKSIQLFSITKNTYLTEDLVAANVNFFVNIRKEPSIDSPVVGRLTRAGVARAISSENGWTKIVSGDIKGYIKSEYLFFGDEAKRFIDDYYANNVTVRSGTLNMRSGASLNDSIIMQLVTNVSLQVLSSKGSWYEVMLQGSAASQTGYVYKDYVDKEYKYALSVEEAEKYDTEVAYLPVNMVWPLPADHKVYSKFGPRNFIMEGASTYHMGLDIGGETGQSIVAALSGTVRLVVYDNESAGNYVEIDHGNGLVTRYLHCSKLLVTLGQHVTQGEVIAKVGSTGVSTSPHLHFATVLNGEYVDPYPYIKGVQ